MLPDHEEMILRNMELTQLEGGATCEWTDCETRATESVMSVATVVGEDEEVEMLTRTYLLCVKHAVIARTVPTECAIDW